MVLNLCTENNVGLYLTGGLGNQLFQFAAAISVSEGKEIICYEKIGSPRTNYNGEPELFSLNLRKIAKINRKYEDNFFFRKASGYVLRSSISPRKFEKSKFVFQAIRFVSMIIQSISARKLVHPITIPGVGYHKIQFSKLLSWFSTPLLIGYFQSYIWPELAKNELCQLEVLVEGPNLKKLRNEARLKRPIVIHVRRGDYKLETTFGLLGEKYYREALKMIDFEFASHPIWIFSDDEKEARDIFKWLPDDRALFISDVDRDSAASIMAMRLGCAYVIANSTFSWWGAFLSEVDFPFVIAPDPWFIGQDEPLNLIPPNWIRIKY